MSTTLAYTRKFIILKKEYSNIKTISPKGHGKLELKGVRGNITLSLEDAEKENYYNVLLLSKNNSGSIFDLGRVFTDEDGRGKGDFSFNLRDLESKGLSSEKINGILIMRDYSVLLGGYINKEDGSIESYIESIYENSVQRVKEPETKEDFQEGVEDFHKEEVDEEVFIEQIVEEEIEEIEEVIQQEVLQQHIEMEPEHQEEVFNEYVEDIPQEQEEFVEYVEERPQEEEVLVEHVEQELQEQEVFNEYIEDVFEQQSVEEVIQHIYSEEINTVDNFNYMGNCLDEDCLDYARNLNQKNQTTNYILSILRFFDYIEPFKIELDGYNWWKVDLDQDNDYRGFLPYFSYLSGGNAKHSFMTNSITANELMKKYRHYIFGLYNVGDEVKYYIYGVPGKFYTSEHPNNGTTGFNTWIEGREVDGYWLLYIDPMTGKVIYPLNQMVPRD